MWLGVALCLIAQPAAAITIHIDYGYDTNNFFGSGNPQGAAAGIQAKAAMEAAASYFSGILTDSFSAIQTPVPYHSSVSNGVVTWSWQESFTNPTTGSTVTVIDPTVAANQYIVYAGARSLSGSTAGIGAAGAYAWSSNITGTNSFSQSDINQINAITANFQDAVERRGQSGGGFARWGGVVSFDTSSRTWHYDYTTLPSVGETDFYSVAIHELAHSLGFGESNGSSTSAWGALVDGSTFTGINAESQYGGSPVPLSADKAHWAVGTTSVVYGTSIAQEASMDPDILSGTRKRFTARRCGGHERHWLGRDHATWSERRLQQQWYRRCRRLCAVARSTGTRLYTAERHNTG